MDGLWLEGHKAVMVVQLSILKLEMLCYTYKVTENQAGSVRELNIAHCAPLAFVATSAFQRYLFVNGLINLPSGIVTSQPSHSLWRCFLGNSHVQYVGLGL